MVYWLIKTAPKRKEGKKRGKVVHWLIKFASKHKVDEGVRKFVNRLIEVGELLPTNF